MASRLHFPAILWLVVAIVLSGCTTAPEKQKLSWARLNPVGLTLTLKDPTGIVVYSLAKNVYPPTGDRVACADLGIKDGAVCGPIFTWEIKGDMLIIRDPDNNNRVYDRLQLLQKHGNEVVVRDLRGISTYEMARL